MMRKQTEQKWNRMVELYESGMVKEDIVTEMIKEGWDISLPTYYRIRSLAGGYPYQSVAKHYQSKIDKERNRS